MGKNSDIAWTHHSFNPWIGCTKISRGCEFCYAAEMMDVRWQRVKWGPNGTRQRTSDHNWRQPLAWDRASAKAGQRHRVFCASLADVFEDRPELVPWRRDLLNLICRTPHLDWLVLTKRPQNALRMMVEGGLYACENPALPRPQPNLWIGTSVEDQRAADDRIPPLRNVPAVVRFLSVEPMLGHVDLDLDRVDWVICGCESGQHRRPMDVRWAEFIAGQCAAVGIPFFMKQMDVGGKVTDDPADFPAHLRIRQYPVLQQAGTA